MNRIHEFIETYFYQVLVGVVVVIGVLVIGIFMLAFNHPAKDHPQSQEMAATVATSTSTGASQSQATSAGTASTAATSASQSTNQQFYVDVKGAVKNPGVYQVGANMRVVDAIDLAGGFNRSADRKQINLAQKLADQQVVYVPIKGEIKGNRSLNATPSQSAPAASSDSAAVDSAAQAPAGPTGSSDQTGKVNLNTADKTKLQELNGIGDKKADQIIAYRQAHGQFKRIEELKDVPGFGDKTFDNLKSSICV